MKHIAFEKETELDIDSRYFDVNFVNEGGVNERTEFEFRTDVFYRTVLIKYWFRYYPYEGPNKMRIKEYRFYNIADDYNYLIVVNAAKCFYIKWKSRTESKEKYSTSDIGRTTVYLETNLPVNIIEEYFPDVNCKISVKKWKYVKMKFGDLFPSSFSDTILSPVFE